MKATTRRSLRRMWRAMTRPLWGHLALALGIGFACGIAARRYPAVIAPSYAAVLGALFLYPLMLAIWWRLYRSRGKRR